MKITRILTYNVNEDYVRDFFYANWWEENTYIGSEEFECFIDGLRDDGYDDEEIIYDKGVQEKIAQIWQEECDNYHRETKEENQKEVEKEILEDIQFFKNKIAFLENRLKNMRGE